MAASEDDTLARDLAVIDRLSDASRAAPTEIEPQIKLWTAVAALDRWFFIDRGTPEAPRPYSLAAPGGTMLCIYTSAERAAEAARANGLVAEGAAVPMFAVPLPDAIAWVTSFGSAGVVGVTLDYPRIGAWCPLPNLARLR